jgi:hypothetical protein
MSINNEDAIDSSYEYGFEQFSITTVKKTLALVFLFK